MWAWPCGCLFSGCKKHCLAPKMAPEAISECHHFLGGMLQDHLATVYQSQCKALSKQQASPSSEEPDTCLLKPHLNQFMDKPPGLPNHGLSASPKHKQALAFRPDPLLTASYLTIYHTNLIHLNNFFFKYWSKLVFKVSTTSEKVTPGHMLTLLFSWTHYQMRKQVKFPTIHAVCRHIRIT